MTTPELLVSDVMSAPPLVVVGDYDSVWHALERFTDTGLQHLVVLDEQDGLVGVLADRLVLAGWPMDAMGLHHQTVGQLLHPVPDTVGSSARVRASATVREAGSLMLAQRVDAVAVVDDRGVVVGIITGSDLVRSLVRPVDQPAVGAVVPSVVVAPVAG
jgi:acetoin utilization protein AcuB